MYADDVIQFINGSIQMKGIFADMNFYFLALTIVVAAVHMIFDYLTFKNDVQFWKGRKTMVGVSIRTLLWYCFADVIIFLYLLDEKTSYLVLVPSGIYTIIEFWKLKKALKVCSTAAMQATKHLFHLSG